MADKNTTMRIPPQSLEAEQAVLGCILIDPEAFSKTTGYLKPESFYKPAHTRIFMSMIELFEKGESIDTITLIAKLQKNGELDNVGGAYYITGLSGDAPSAENVEYYAKIVQEKYILRNIISFSVDMATLAYESKDEPIDILDKVEQNIFSLSQNSLQTSYTHVEPLISQILDNLGTKKSKGLLGIPSHITGLDDLLSGFQNSDLIILAGRPSMGKTALALTMARNAAVGSGYNVGIFSLEMSKLQLAERLITAEARVDSHLMRTNRLPKKEWKKLSAAADKLTAANIYIDDTPGINVMEIRAKARRMKVEHKIDILFVDYLQLISGLGRSENRQQELSKISRSLKALAKELDIPVVALSQLSRNVENRTDHRPIMSDLRESGAIEQDADVILFIYRKYVYSRNDEDKGLGEIIIAKHRNGPTGLVQVAFVDRYAWFGNLEPFVDVFAGEEEGFAS